MAKPLSTKKDTIDEDRSQNVKKPGGLLDQWNLVRAATQDDRLSRGDIAVLVAILQRYWPKFGNGWASIDMLVEMSGMSRRQIVRVLRSLQDTGYVDVLAKGRRGRATVFLPNFSLGYRFSDMHGTESNDNNLGDTDGTELTVLGDIDGTVSPLIGDTDGTPSYLRDRPTRDGNTVSRTEDAHGIAQLGPVGAAALPRDPKEEFDELYKAYGLRRKRAEAKSVYEKIAPDADLHARMVEAAGHWHSSYEENGTHIKWRKHLHSWLAKECWEEDPPVAYVDAKEAAIAKAKDRGPKPAAQIVAILPDRNLHEMRIVGVSQEGNANSEQWHVILELAYIEGELAGQTVVHDLHVFNAAGPAKGNSAWTVLCKITELSFNINDLKGRAVKVMNLPDGGIGFARSFLPPSEEIVEVAIVGAKASPVEPSSDEECLEILMMTDDDINLEWFAMLKSNDMKEQADDQRRIASLLTAVGVTGVEDERDLIGKRLKIIKWGKQVKEFLPYQGDMARAA
ncbi:helix-turn-helix domain-containing protein [Phyllobacterium zundukense]|uniref:Helix-turn-helix domain-containing protein n=1 Tax=Phyllobacterium zundukense TaxID=1867719 RepID=A0A2N9VS44_9HYPH|nr:helix-turn-helix domain-containing protein [Phyllobacterium zundukense]ATU92735.1 hypothetical protein BLM14_14680 [Phyllobacterium zundukense]PIO42312.1 hypothetical protein B5P45_25135 [Phyllobacterium zundukense]